MDNWAQSFQRLLIEVQKLGNPKDRFLSVAADVLKIEGQNREILAALKIFEMIKNIESGISQLGYDGKDETVLRNYLNPFDGLTNLMHIHLDINSARQNFLNDSNILGLASIDFAFRGVISKSNITEELDTALKKLKDALEEVLSSKISEKAKSAIKIRLGQIEAVLNSRHYFDGDEAERILNELVGALVSASITEPKQRDILKRASAIALVALGALSGIEAATGHIANSTENIGRTIEAFEDISADVSDDDQGKE